MNGTAKGLLVGALVGYPLSYFFQPGALRAKISMGEYISHMGEIFRDKELSSTATLVWAAATVVGAVVGRMLERRPEAGQRLQE